MDKSGEHFETYKVSLRHVNAHAIVNAAFSLVLGANQIVVGQPIFAYGNIVGKATRSILFSNVISNLFRMTKTEQFLVGKSVTDPNVFKGALQVLKTVIKSTQV